MDLDASWPLADGHDLRDELLAAYADPSRGYHDSRHLAEVCARVEELCRAGVACDRTVVLLAAWFHDSVYDGERDAEERSAAWAERALPGLGLADATVSAVARLVRMTETHRPGPDDADACVLSDADLAILAASPGRYAEYTADVRREYAHVCDDDFRAGRRAVLESLLAGPHLFHTAHAREHWEAAARANVEAELVRLAAAPSAG